MDALIIGFYGSLTFILVRKLPMFRARSIPSYWLWSAYGAKFAAAMLMLWLYAGIKREKADIFRFWDDSQVIFSALKNSPADYFKMVSGIGADDKNLEKYYLQTNNWPFSEGSSLFSNNRFLIRYLALLSLFAFGSYGGVLIITLFLSFTGLFWVFRFFYRQLPQKSKIIFFVVFFTPSILFWSSALLKESLLWFFTGMVLNCGSMALKGKKPLIRMLLLLFSFFAMFQIKAFAALFLFAAAVPYVYNFYAKPSRPFISYFVALFVLVSLASESDKIFDPGVYKLIVSKKEAFEKLAIQDNAKTYISTPALAPDTFSFARNLPGALMNVLLRPFPGEIKGVSGALMFLENILLLLLISAAVFRREKKIEKPNLFWFSMLVAFLFFALIGLSVPVLGAVSRYRTIPLLFFETALIMLIDFGALKTTVRRLFPTIG